MRCHSSDSSAPVEASRGGTSRKRAVTLSALLAFLGIALFFLLSEHRAHLYGALPYLLVLACPLIHVFHHRAHGHHHQEQVVDHGKDRAQDRPAPEGGWK